MVARRSPAEIEARWQQRRKSIARAKALRAQGKTIVAIANELRCSPTTVWMWLNFQGAGTGRDIRKAAS